jgi:uncharacterized protein (DUF1330 family)
MMLVVILSVRSERVESFHEFERKAASIMARHGGSIERTVTIGPEGGDPFFKEVHIVTFPDEGSFAAYRNDEGFATVAHLREESIIETEILVGRPGPVYGA